jgi:hypothetical protein
MEKKQVAQGIDNFKKLIDNNSYYVDKSLLIKDLLDRNDEVTLITRPRRFGKTLNMSLLKYFFERPECRKLDLEDVDTSYLFKDLKIWNAGEKYKVHMGKYPMIYLTFKNAKQDNWKKTLGNLKKTIAAEYRRHNYILDSDVLSDYEKEKYIEILNLKADEDSYTDILIELAVYLKRYFKHDCMIIIDEYDTPIQAGYLNGYFNEVIEFMKSMLVKGFKDNKALKKGVLTGIMKVAQESIFSDFNNPLVCTVLSQEFSQYFGFTEPEVEEMAEYFGFSIEMEGIKEWYNGYIFGTETVIYNPWSIIKYLYNPKNGLKPYWVNTSDNMLIREVMQLDKAEGKRVVEKLLKAEDVVKIIHENISYQSIKDNYDVAWSFLLHGGYLKAYEREMVGNRYFYKIAIPNIEIMTIYEDTILNYFKEDAKITPDITELINSLMEVDLVRFGRILSNLYLKQVSYHDTINLGNIEEMEEVMQKERFQNFHHGFFLGLFMLASNEYQVMSNREYGLGRPDIVLLPIDVNRTAYVFEFKWDSTKSKITLEILSQTAIKQMEAMKYIEGIKLAHGLSDVVGIGIGFKGKALKMELI